jgi:hypothetical protein
MLNMWASQQRRASLDALVAGILAGNPSAWYDPSDLSTLFQDTAGTTPVTADGQSVARVNDKSGNGHHLLQATAAQQPVYRLIGGRHSLQFDGTDDGLATSGNITPGTDKAQIVAGVRKLSDASVGVLVETSLNAAGNLGTISIRAPGQTSPNGNYETRSRGDGTLRAAGFARAAPDTSVVTGLSDISAPNCALRLDGAQVASNTASQGVGNYLPYPLYVGRRGSPLNWFNGHIYGIILRFGPNLSAPDLATLEQWAAEKSGVTLP